MLEFVKDFKMKEIINIGVGQAGVQISDSLIELYLAEHHLDSRGRKIEESEIDQEKCKKVTAQRKSEHLESIFEESQTSILRPRFVLMDTEPDVIDQSLKSEFKDVLIEEYMISGKESAATYARGYFNNINKFAFGQSYMNSISKAVQRCDSLEAFVINHSIEGGTGSGCVSALMEKLSDTFPKILRSNFVVGVQKDSFTSVVGPYNVELALAKIIAHSDTTVLSCNRSLHSIAKTHLDIQYPNYQNINKLIAQSNSFYTMFNRFSTNSLVCDMQDFRTNLVIYPRIHFAIPSFSPLIKQDDSYKWGQIYSEGLMLAKCYDRSCHFQGQNSIWQWKEDKNLSAIILARGEINQDKLARAGRKIMKKNKWVDHLPTALKIGISPLKARRHHENQIDSYLRKSLMCFRSSMKISHWLDFVNHTFDKMYRRRAFVHWFVGDGLEEMEFSQVRQDLAALEKDYEQLIYTDYCDGCQEYSGSEDDDY